MAAKTAHAAGVHTGRKSAREPFLDNLDAHTLSGQMKCGRTAVQSTADNDDVLRFAFHGSALYCVPAGHATAKPQIFTSPKSSRNLSRL